VQPEKAENPDWRKYGVTPAPVSDLTAKVLESIGLHLRPVTKDDFREENVFANYSGGLRVTFARTGGPAEKSGFRGDIIVKLQGRLTLSLADLDAAMQDAAEQIKRKEADSLQFDVLRSGKTVRINVPFPNPAKDLKLVFTKPMADGDVAPKTETGTANPHWRRYGVTPAPVSELTAKVLESIGLHLRPITKDLSGGLGVSFVRGLDVRFVRTHGAAEKAGFHEVDIVVKLQGKPVATLAELDTAIKLAAEQIERQDGGSLQFDVLRSGEAVRVDVPFPNRQLDRETKR
jgi:S1-C subfamily serine protease